MELLLAIVVAIVTPYVVGIGIAHVQAFRQELELLRMGCHPRQRQIERKLYRRPAQAAKGASHGR